MAKGGAAVDYAALIIILIASLYVFLAVGIFARMLLRRR
jgi:hypothetical protein